MSVFANSGGVIAVGGASLAAPVVIFQSYDLPTPVFDSSLRTWIQVGVQYYPPLYQLRGPHFSNPRDLNLRTEQRTWEWSYNRNLIGKDKLPFRQQDWPNPRNISTFYYWVDDNNWTNSYTLALIGKDKLPTRSTDRPNPPPVNWYRSWEWNYNLNLIGKDKLPNRNQIPLPSPVSWYQEWIETGNALTFVAPGFPNNQDDWPNPVPVYWYRTWDQNLASRAPVFLPVPFDWGYQEKLAWYRDWSQNLISLLTATAAAIPFNQDDWPLPSRLTWYKDWSKTPTVIPSYLPLPVVIDNPVPVMWYQSWIRTLGPNDLLPPFRQLDWPLPRDPRDKRSWETWYNLNLIGKDQFPIRQQDWPLFPKVVWYQDWIKFPQLQVVGNPFSQTNWPNPQVPTWYRDLNNNLVFILPTGTKPFLQSDWPLPQPVRWFQDFNENIVLLFPPPVVVVTDLHFKPVFTSMGRLGNLGGLS